MRWYWWPVAALVWVIIIATALMWVPLLWFTGHRMAMNHLQLANLDNLP